MHHAVQLHGILCSWGSLRIPASPKVFLSPSDSLYEGFSCNREAVWFHPAMRHLIAECRGLSSHHSNARQQFPSFRAAESRRQYPLLPCQLLCGEIIPHAQEGSAFKSTAQGCLRQLPRLHTDPTCWEVERSGPSHKLIRSGWKRDNHTG